MASERPHRYPWPWLSIFGVFACIAGVTAWYRMHMDFQFYDDEGFLLLTLKQFLDGRKLYDEIFTFYGPFYYLSQALLYRVTGFAVSHDAVRLFSVIPWTIVPLLCAWIVFRACRSVALDAVTHLAVFASLTFFTWDPGQPQEICMMLFVLLALTLYYVDRGVAMAAIAGLLVGLLTLCKVNAGIFGALAVGLTLLLRARPGTLRNILLAGLAVATTAMPAVLMHSSHGTWVQQWLFMATATIAGSLMCALKQRSTPTPTSLRNCIAAATAFLAGMVLVVTPLLIGGHSLKAMVRMLIFRVSRGGTYFEMPAGFDLLSIVSGVAAVLVAAAYCLGIGGRVVTGVIFAMRLALGVIAILCGLSDLGRVFFIYLSPWVWLVGVGKLGEGHHADSRIGICLLAAIQTLWAFPMAPHIHFASILLIVSAVICMGDSLPGLYDRIGIRSLSANRHGFTAAAICLLVLAGHLYKLQTARSRYASMVPLDLPGAHAVRVLPAQYRLYHEAVQQIHQSCNGFITMPALNSLYFWSRQDSPTAINLTAWIGVLDDVEQQQMTDDFARVTRPCVVQCPAVMKLWLQGRPLPRRPLVRWIEEHFQPAASFEGCHLLTWKQP